MCLLLCGLVYTLVGLFVQCCGVVVTVWCLLLQRCCLGLLSGLIMLWCWLISLCWLRGLLWLFCRFAVVY